MLLPRLPTYTTASSSSCSFAFEMHTSPSVDPESRRWRERSSPESAEEDREKCTEVMSSEWVDVCFLSGAAGCRGSLQSPIITRSVACLFRDIQYKRYAICVRTNTRLAHLLPLAQFRRLLSSHLLIRHRKRVLFVALRTALQDVTGRFSVL